ncbi:HTH-type transcriptional regulator [Gordonia insulae]|uniref:HTH-type transcriptional regulator n=1 Tax=Gordonia insulae TaxID=2420509 RepID=A0A3G8JUV3_9ACTN|nr:HTH-type transcriptional regulator [Gordonia insulae]
MYDAIADPVRRRILRSLADGPCRVVDLREALAAHHPISRPAVSRHLRVLAEAGLVVADERGRERHYRFDATPLDEVREFVHELRSARHAARPPIDDSMLDALDTEVHRTKRERRTTALVDEQEESA